MNSFACESVNASVKSASAWAKGLSEVYESLGSLVQSSLSHSKKISDSLSGAKSLHDVVSTQSSLLKESVERFSSELSKISQISARTAQQAAEPVTNHFNAAISKLSKSKAA